MKSLPNTAARALRSAPARAGSRRCAVRSLAEPLAGLLGPEHIGQQDEIQVRVLEHLVRPPVGATIEKVKRNRARTRRRTRCSARA
jgi:hypothetical protein